MADNNNVCGDCAARNLTKLRLLCDALLREARSEGIALEELAGAYARRKYSGPGKIASAKSGGSARQCHWRWWAAAAGAALVLAAAVALALRNELLGGRCLVRNNYLVMEASRPRASCERVCAGVEGAEELAFDNLSRPDFVGRAYLSRPLVVRAGAAHWPALGRFSVAFFRSLYDGVDGAYEAVMEDCQFLPFRTEYQDLRAALAMHPARAARLPGTKPWYFGWSNCSPGVSVILRHLAPRPAFLPVESESSALDWIFMGGQGPGAAWHLDYVQRPSWQAQISGTKTWHFRPVPECQQVCQPFSATINKGDIIFVDTNQWYHTTYIHEGELSITIGSEYD